MLERFINSFKSDHQDNMQTPFDFSPGGDVMHCLAGLSFENGLYRFYTDTEREKWTDVVISVYHQYKDRVSCFSSDWLGRQFAIDSARVVNNQPQILMFQVGLGEVFEIPSGIEGFHDDVLVNMPNPTLEKTMYRSWLEAGNVAPERSQCAGYKIPPFLGGTDDLSNLKIISMEIEWNITGQLLDVIARIPRGSRIDGIKLDNDVS